MKVSFLFAANLKLLQMTIAFIHFYPLVKKLLFWKMLVIIFVGHHLTQITWQKISLGGSCFSGVRVTVNQSIETYRRCASLVRTKGFKDLRPTMVIKVTRNKLKWFKEVYIFAIGLPCTMVLPRPIANLDQFWGKLDNR